MFVSNPGLNAGARRKEIARRYRRKRKESEGERFARVRIAEIECLIRHREGNGALPKDFQAAWTEIEERIYKPTRWRSGRLGIELQLLERERVELNIRTIRSIDGPSPEERKQRKRQRDFERQARKRAEAGCLKREDYLAQSTERLKPWEQQRISRRKWFYRQQAERAVQFEQFAQVCRASSSPTKATDQCNGSALNPNNPTSNGSGGGSVAGLSFARQRTQALASRAPADPLRDGRWLGSGERAAIVVHPVTGRQSRHGCIREGLRRRLPGFFGADRSTRER